MKSVFFLGLLMVCCLNIKTTDSAACPAKLDLVFMVDSSGSIGTSNWEILTDFLVLVVDRFNIGPDAVRVAVVRFASTVTVQWKLDSQATASKSALKSSLKNIRYTKGKTSTPYALYVVANQVLEKAGDRADVPNLVVVVTDGKSNAHTSYLNQYAANLKTLSRVLAIGVTQAINYNELAIIASNNCEWYTVDEFTQMDNDMDKTMDLICGCMPGQYQNSACECKNCANNTYQPQWASTSCRLCPTGMTTLGAGSRQCTDYCEPGYMIRTDGQGCELCAKGTYQPNKNLHMCIPCDNGFTTLQAGATDKNMCIVLCDKGKRPVLTSNTCEPCPRGTYKPTTYSQYCMECPPNKTTYYEGATEVKDCIDYCQPGYMITTDRKGCVMCPKGTYQPNKNIDSCMPCENGFTTLQTGATDKNMCIEICDAGLFLSNITDDCEPCPKNFYKSNKSSEQCIPCPDGTITLDIGSDDPDHCFVPSKKQTSPDASTGGGGNTGLIAGLVTVALLLIIVGVVLFVFFFVIRRRRKDSGASGEDFKIPPKDPAHVYNIPEETGPTVYDNPTLMYDNFGDLKSSQLKNPNDDVEYSNNMDISKPEYSNAADLHKPEYSNSADIHKPEYSNAADLHKPNDEVEIGESPYEDITSNKWDKQNLDNPLYENQHTIGIIKGTD